MACRVFVSLVLTVFLGCSAAEAASGQDVLLVVNGAHPFSAQVAERYRALHAVPDDQVVTLQLELADRITRADYNRLIEQPVAAWIEQAAAHDRITYLVLMPGIPTQVVGTVGRTGTVASVDSELALLYRALTGTRPGPVGPLRNPYFAEAPTDGQWPAFDRSRLDIYLVTRLDGFTADDVLALVGRCSGATPGGRFVLDDRAPLDVREHRWFAAAAARLTDAVGADRVVFDRTLSTVRDEGDVMGFYSWGTADPGHRQRQVPLTFRPGAIAASLASTDARTFTAPPEGWRPGSWQARNSYYKGSPEWLAADLVRSGLTGVAGNVSDPYADGAVRPDVLFPAYASGRTLGEAMYLATPSLSWQTVVVGDPLCRPFGGAAETAPTFTTHEPSGLTQPFFGRLLDNAVRNSAGQPTAAVEALISARLREGRGDRAGALAILDALVAAHPQFVAGLEQRGQTLDADGKRDQAVEAYRAVLAVAPDSIVALNNLAYLLVEASDGVHPEALTHARRAYEVSKGSGVIADTYGWVLFRTGETGQAERVLRDAVARQPAMAELRLHLARVLLAQGQLPAAKEQWDRALTLDAGVRDHAHAGPLVETFASTR